MPSRLVRNPRLESLLEEYGRKVLGKDLPDDPTVAKVLAIARGTTEILCSLHTHRPKLEVSDAPSLEEFLKNARKVYRKAHPPEKRGRKSSVSDALVWVARLEHELKRQPTRKEIISHVTDKDQCGSYPVSLRIAEKVAKLYLQLTQYSFYGRTGPPLSKEDVRWLRRNLRPILRSSNNWWTQILEQWQHAKLDATGFSREIREVFSLSSEDLAEQRKKYEALRLQLTFGKQ